MHKGDFDTSDEDPGGEWMDTDKDVHPPKTTIPLEEKLSKRQKLDAYLEAKQLRDELEQYDKAFEPKGSYYSDDIFDDG